MYLITEGSRPQVLRSVLPVVCLALAASALAQPIQVIAPNGRGSIPVREIAGAEMIPLEAVANLVDGLLRPSERDAINLSANGKLARVSNGGNFVPVEGQMKMLSAPATVVSEQWFVPVDFLTKVLPLLSDVAVSFQPRQRMLVLGEGFPTLRVRSTGRPEYTRVEIVTGRDVPVEVQQGEGAVRVRIQTPFLQTDFRGEEILDGVVETIRLERDGEGYVLTVSLGERFGQLKAFERQDPEQSIVLDLIRSLVPTANRETPSGEPEEIRADLSEIEPDEPDDAIDTETASEPAPGAANDEPGMDEDEPGMDEEDDFEGQLIELPPDYETGVRHTPDLPIPARDGPAQLRIITLDPGHGGAETGATGRSGLQEKEVVLEITRRVRRLLQERLGIRVLLTRDGDSNIELDERTAFANSNKSDLFISIHADASPRRSARGSSVYYLSYPSSETERGRVAMAQNGSVSPPADDLQFILWDMAQASHLNQSARLAEILQEELTVETGGEKVNRGIKQNTFRVLMGATMPAVLVELGFISNENEESLLGTESYQDKLAEAIYRGVLEYKQLYEGSTGERASRGRQ